MDLGAVNWLAVIACVVVSMVSGMLWYNPRTLFPAWWKGIGKSDSDIPGGSGGMGLTWALTILSSVVQAAFMSLAVALVGRMSGAGATLLSGMATGFLVWLGAIAPTYLVNKLFAGHGWKVWAIEAGNHLVNFVIFGAILGAWH
jgi:hypothetical protein